MWRLSGLKLKWTTKFICGPMLHHRPHVLSLCLLPLPFSDVTFQFSKDKKFLFFQFCLFCSHGIYQLLPLSSRETRSTAQWPPSAGFFQRLLLKWGGRERKRDWRREGKREKDRQTERMIYFMDLTPLRFSGILIIKVWYSNLSRVWTNWHILRQLSLLKTSFLYSVKIISFWFFQLP